MKKAILCSVLLLCLTGCLNTEVKDVFVKPVETTEEIKFLYNPGTYEGSEEGYNGLITVQVTVTESKITKIVIISSSEIDYVLKEETTTDEPTEDENGEIVDDPVSGEEISIEGSLQSAINDIILSQSTSGIEIQTGATVSTNALLEAVQRALNEASL